MCPSHVREQLLPEACKECVVGVSPEVGVGPGVGPVRTVLEDERDLLPDATSTVDPVGIVLGGGEDDAAIVKEAGVNVHHTIDATVPREGATIEPDSLFHVSGGMLDCGEAVLGPQLLQNKKFAMEIRAHRAGVCPGFWKIERRALPFGVDGAEAGLDAGPDFREEGWKSGENTKKKIGG